MHAAAASRAALLVATAAAACMSLAWHLEAQGASRATAATTRVGSGQIAPTRAAAAGRRRVFQHPGIYTYVPDPGQAPAIKQAVDHAVRHMFPIAKGIAHGRLMETNKMPDTLRLIVTPDTLGTQTDRDKPMALPRSGVTVRWDDGTGDVCRARDSVAADTLAQFCNSKDGASVTRYVLMNGGQGLRMIVHITSSHLSGPVDYAIDFRRR